MPYFLLHITLTRGSQPPLCAGDGSCHTYLDQNFFLAAHQTTNCVRIFRGIRSRYHTPQRDIKKQTLIVLVNGLVSAVVLPVSLKNTVYIFQQRTNYVLLRLRLVIIGIDRNFFIICSRLPPLTRTKPEALPAAPCATRHDLERRLAARPVPLCRESSGSPE